VLNNDEAGFAKNAAAVRVAVQAAKEWHAGPVGAAYKAKTDPPEPGLARAIPPSASRLGAGGAAKGPVIAPRVVGGDSPFTRIVAGASSGASAPANKRQRK
jgi:hypothetical protein